MNQNQSKVEFNPKSVDKHQTNFNDLLYETVSPDCTDISKCKEFDIQSEGNAFKLFMAIVEDNGLKTLIIMGRRFKGNYLPITLEYMPILFFIAEISNNQFTSTKDIQPLASGNFLITYDFDENQYKMKCPECLINIPLLELKMFGGLCEGCMEDFEIDNL